MLLQFVIIYLIVSVAIGLYAATKVKNSTDFVVAGRHLPLPLLRSRHRRLEYHVFGEP